MTGKDFVQAERRAKFCFSVKKEYEDLTVQ